MKTPMELHNQTKRIMRNIALQHWDGKQYVNHPQMMAKMERVKGICSRYVDSIYRHNGFSTNGQGIATSGTTNAINHIWHYGATERKVYAGY